MTLTLFCCKGSSINDVTVLGRVKDFVTAVLKALVIKSVTVGGGGSKIVQNCVTSFKDDPQHYNGFLLIVNKIRKLLLEPTSPGLIQC